jgi:hypothetical protein
MASRAVQLYKYIKLPNLGWRYCKAVFYPNNRVKPHAVVTPSGEKTIKDGCYCLYYNRKWEPVGDDPTEAQRLLMKKRGELLTVAHGGSVVQATEEEPKVSGTRHSPHPLRSLQRCRSVSNAEATSSAGSELKKSNAGWERSRP